MSQVSAMALIFAGASLVAIPLLCAMIAHSAKARYIISTFILAFFGLGMLGSLTLEKAQEHATAQAQLAQQETIHMLCMPIDQEGEAIVTVAYSSWTSLPNLPRKLKELRDFNDKGDKVTLLEGRVDGPQILTLHIPDSIEEVLILITLPDGHTSVFSYAR